MTAKTKKVKATAEPEGEQLKKKVATLSLAPIYNAAALVEAFSGNIYGEVDVFAAADELKQRCGAVHGGDMTRLETMLISQAHSLDVMFASLARRGKVQQSLQTYEVHMKLALRAQSQCRATVEALAAIKNPPVIFAKQANISHGHQQVNNNATKPLTHAEQNAKPQIELLEHDHEQWLDTGTAAAASGSNSPVEAVDTIHRPAQRRRKRHGQP